jgi:hypothetical protein
MRRTPSSDGVEVQAVLVVLSAPTSDSVSSLAVVVGLGQLLSKEVLCKHLLQSEPSAFSADRTARNASSTAPMVLAASSPMSRVLTRISLDAGRVETTGEDG